MQISKRKDITTPAALREKAYNTDRSIEWRGKLYTATELGEQYKFYAAEGDIAKTAEIQIVNKSAKDSIRAKYPD